MRPRVPQKRGQQEATLCKTCGGRFPVGTTCHPLAQEQKALACCREPPKAEKTMKGAVKIGISTGALFYIAVATFGYLGLGNDVPDDILTAFDRPKWVPPLPASEGPCLAVLQAVGVLLEVVLSAAAPACWMLSGA